MSKLNEKASVRANTPRELSTYEKAERTLMTCMLFEDNFYEDGVSVSERLASYVKNLDEKDCRKLLKQAKIDNKLRHAPLFWANKMLKNGKLKQEDVTLVCDRVDEMADFLALYWGDKSNKHAVPKVLSKGLATSLTRFDEYQLAKYRGKSDSIKLRDVIRIAHPKPENDTQSDLWKRAIAGELKTPDTWEVAISACGSDKAAKKAEWTRLLTEKTEKGYNKLGALAILRNLRNMREAGVSDSTIRAALKECSTKRVLPFQIVNAADHSVGFEDILEDKLLESANGYEQLSGSTIILVDVSGSMTGRLAAKSEVTRQHVAASLAAIAKYVSEDAEVYAFDTDLYRLKKNVNGLAMVSSITSMSGGGTSVIDCTNKAIDELKKHNEGAYPSRVIVVTDEQTNSDGSYGWGRRAPLDKLSNKCQGYIINVGCYGNGVAYANGDNRWTHISGWSDNIIRFINAVEDKKK